MQFNKVDMQGKFFNQRVADISLLVWQASDEGRSLYDEATQSLWLANASAWVQAGGAFSSGTAQWFYQDIAPTGWTIVATTQDTLLGVKYGAGTYTTGGSVQGAWANLEHSHAAGSLVGGTHNHRWYVYNGTDGYTFQSNGSSSIFFSSSHGTKSTNGLMSVVTHADSYRWNQNSYTENATPSLSGSTAASTTLTAARPAAHVGIICTKN
jgi:hypothetical protein